MDTIVSRLLARGNDLRESANQRNFEDFEKAIGIHLSPSFQNFYTLFNGFKSADCRSQIFLWGLDEMASRNLADPHLREGKSIAIGDLMIDSDFLIADVSQDAGPIRLLYEKREVASDIVEFLTQIASGKLDFNDLDP